jgi:squalene-associated FAD-dependent desaturase
MKVVVVGGGIAGLAAATRLVQNGHQVALYEKRPTLGGRAYSIVDDTTGHAIDNGQHVLMGCCRALRDFLERIGASDQLKLQRDLDVQFVDERGARRRFHAAPLPAPLHLLGGIAGFATLGLRDRLNLLKVAAGIVRPTALFPAASDFETVERWLDRIGQSAEARRGFWYPLTRAVLNDEPRSASAKMLEAILREAFFGSRDDARIGMARGGLSELYAEPAARWLEQRSARVVTAAPIESLTVTDGVVRGVVLRDGTSIEADAVIAALPPRPLLALIGAHAHDGETWYDGVRRLRGSPIVSVHVWLEEKPAGCEMLGLVERPIHWIFDRGTHLSLVTSAATGLIDRSTDEIGRIAVEELRRVLPQVTVKHLRVLKEREATLAHTAGSESDRPHPRSPIGGLFVAGDWVRTGLPCTLESAVRAADLAAAHVEDWLVPPAHKPASSPAFVPLSSLVRPGARDRAHE